MEKETKDDPTIGVSSLYIPGNFYRSFTTYNIPAGPDMGIGQAVSATEART